MKLNYFYGSIAVRQCDGYTENLEFNVTESKGLTFRYPYGDATPEEAEAISRFIKTVTDAYNRLTVQIDGVNRDLRLEQYAPVVSSEKIASKSTDVSAAPQPSHGTRSNNLDYTDLVAHSEAEQERLDMEEVKTKRGNPVDVILTTESSPEDGEAVAYFAEGLGKIIDARKKKIE